MTKLRVEGFPGAGIAVIGGELWAKSKARKRSWCVVSDKRINVGDATYRPIGNGNNRMLRALASAVDARRPAASPSLKGVAE